MSETRTLAENDAAHVAEHLAELVGGSAAASKIFGEAVERDGVTIVPVGRTRWGFGGGGGQEKGGRGSAGSGGGGGATVRPIGFIEIRDGHARFRRIVDPATVGAVLLGLVVLGLAALRRGRSRQACARRSAHAGAGVGPPAGDAERLPAEPVAVGETEP